MISLRKRNFPAAVFSSNLPKDMFTIRNSTSVTSLLKFFVDFIICNLKKENKTNIIYQNKFQAWRTKRKKLKRLEEINTWIFINYWNAERLSDCNIIEDSHKKKG